MGTAAGEQGMTAEESSTAAGNSCLTTREQGMAAGESTGIGLTADNLSFLLASALLVSLWMRKRIN